MADVEDAWGLVHNAVVRHGAIPASPLGIYTVPQAITPDTLVVLARLVNVPFATVTAIPDNPAGFTLDAAFPDDMPALRAEGRQLMELCFFADRRASIARSFMSVVETARFAFFYARHLGVTDIITAVPIDHASFLMKYFAFERVGGRERNPLLHGSPCSLLRLRIAERLERRPLPPEIAYYLDKPVSPAEFDRRYRFSEAELCGSNIARLLKSRPAEMTR
ncbi:MAG: hypothetical protein ABSH20_16680 [Tepidisphaeraceae bacterium]